MRSRVRVPQSPPNKVDCFDTKVSKTIDFFVFCICLFIGMNNAIESLEFSRCIIWLLYLIASALTKSGIW